MDRFLKRIVAAWVPALIVIYILVFFVPEQRTEARAILHYFTPPAIAILAMLWTAGVAIAAIRKPLTQWWRAEIFVRGKHWDEYDPNPRNQEAAMAARERR